MLYFFNYSSNSEAGTGKKPEAQGDFNRILKILGKVIVLTDSFKHIEQGTFNIVFVHRICNSSIEFLSSDTDWVFQHVTQQYLMQQVSVFNDRGKKKPSFVEM